MVAIREVGPRDGFQNEPDVIATDDKVRLVEMLARTGLSRLEVTSFVRADVIPQLADGAEVLRRADIPESVDVTVLIPNERGLDNALELRERFGEVNLFLSASETHNRRNVNRSIEESLSGLERVVARARAEGLRCEGVISTSFGCPYEGEVPEERVFGIARRLAAAGCEEVAFGDTTGMANPRQVRGFFERAREELDVQLTAHFHNTRGQGLANVVAALEAGVESFESSFGELGGCPVPARRHGQHRHRGPGVHAPRDGSRDRGGPARARGVRPRGPARAGPPAGQPRAHRGPRGLARRGGVMAATGLRSDVEALAGMVRDSAGPGERASAEWAAGRLRELGAEDVSGRALPLPVHVRPAPRARTSRRARWPRWPATGCWRRRCSPPSSSTSAGAPSGCGRRCRRGRGPTPWAGSRPRASARGRWCSWPTTTRRTPA